MKRNKNSLNMKMFFFTLLALTSILPSPLCSGVSRTDDRTPHTVSPPPLCKSSPVTCTPPPPCPACPPPSPTARPGPCPSLGREPGVTTSAPPYRLNWGPHPTRQGTSLPGCPLSPHPSPLSSPPFPLPQVSPLGLAPPCTTAGAWTPPTLGLAPPCSTAGAWTPPTLGLAPSCRPGQHPKMA